MQRLSRFLIALPLLAATLLTPVFAASAPSRSAAAQRTAGAPVNPDAQIDATIRTKLAKSKIGKDGFKFHVQRGVVTWDGSTNVMQHKGSATRMARAAGAIQVVNNIQVSGDAKTKSFASMKRAYVK